MRLKGRITNWKDEQGFGFIAPSGGGSEAFVHISSFAHRGRRPKTSDLVTYRLSKDAQGRLRAIDVQFVGERSGARSENGSLWFAMASAVIFFAALVGAVSAGKLPSETLLIYLGASLVAFMAYWFDKSAARHARWRTPESTLHAIGLLGGWPGSLLAMYVFRHKSKKASFQWTFWATVFANCLGLFWLTTKSGAKALTSMLGGG